MFDKLKIKRRERNDDMERKQIKEKKEGKGVRMSKEKERIIELDTTGGGGIMEEKDI